MGLKEWKKHFYPKDPWEGMSEREAIVHSLNKWEGALPENLKAYGVSFACGEVHETGTLSFMDYPHYLLFNDDTCALCVNFRGPFASQNRGPLGDCAACPLAQHLGESCAGNSLYSL
jgi:hypothetical protein